MERNKAYTSNPSVVTVVLPQIDGKHVHHIRLVTKPDVQQAEMDNKLGCDLYIIKKKRITIDKTQL